MKTASKTLMICSILVFFAGVAFSQVASTAPAAKADVTKPSATAGTFVDNNHNGICDNHENGVAGSHGKNFVDKNGDGKCDNCGATGKCAGPCGANCQKHGNCDRKGQAMGNCCGNGNRHRHGCTVQESKSPETQPKK